MSGSDEESNAAMRDLNRLMADLSSPSQSGRGPSSSLQKPLEVKKKRSKRFVKTRQELEQIYGGCISKSVTSSQLTRNYLCKTSYPSKRVGETERWVSKRPKIQEKDSYSPISFGSASDESEKFAGVSSSLLRKLFSKVVFTFSGNFGVDKYRLLTRGGATHYQSVGSAISHFIVCDGADMFAVQNAKTWYGHFVHFVQPEWVFQCIQKDKLLGSDYENVDSDDEGDTTIELNKKVDSYPPIGKSDVVPAVADSSEVSKETVLKERRFTKDLIFPGGDKKTLKKVTSKPKNSVKTSKKCQDSRENQTPPSGEVLTSGVANKDEIIKPRPGEIGLANFGNTCFMNSGLQCLLNTPPLIQLFLNKNIQSYGKGRRDSTGLIESLQNVFHYYWNPNTAGLPMEDFVKNMRDVHKDFDNHRQDCQEFLLVLLNKLDEEIKNASGNKRSRISQIIPKCFQFMMQSELTCSFCHINKKEHEYFYSVPLSFPPKSCEGDPQTKTSRYPSDISYDINGLLAYFVKKESLDNDNFWKCSSCDFNQSATRSQAFCSLPNYLVIHLKRFAYINGGISKIRNSVSFPIDNILDMRDFIHPDFPTGGGLFNLYGCVCHFGGVSSGHYTAYVKNAQTTEWHYFNDDLVKCEKPDESVFSSAYVLFYANTATDKTEN